MPSIFYSKSDLKTPQPTSYPVMETFYSIQGEAYHQGKAAWFIRLAGCNVGCHWCDVKESWHQEDHPQYSTEKLVQDLDKSKAPIAIITGGEPTLHDLTSLTTQIKKKGIKTHLETAGTSPVTGEWDWICFSPKKFKKPLPEIYNLANELKIIVVNKHDLVWAEQHAQLLPDSCHLFLQPEWDQRDSIVPIILNYIRDNPQWRLALQMHKYIGVP